MGYATNNNFKCFDDDIFKLKEKEKKVDMDINNYVGINGNKIVQQGSFLHNYGKFSLQITDNNIHVRKVLVYNKKNGLLEKMFYYGNEERIFKQIEYNEQGEIIKDTFYNNYPICWKEALIIAKHKAHKEINRFKVTELYLTGYIGNDSIPKWRVKLMPHGKETLDEYYDYLYYQGGEGKDKGERNIIINANTGAIIKDFRQRIRIIAEEF